MSSVTGSPSAGGDPGPIGGEEAGARVSEQATTTSEGPGADVRPGQRRRPPHPHRSLRHDLESLLPFIIAVAVLITIVVGLVITVRPHPNTNGTEYRNTYGVFSRGS
jgi:hypothetical protein